MNILMLNEADGGGGAAKAAFRLHCGLQRLGVDTRLLVQKGTSGAPGVLSTAAPAGKIIQALRVHLDMLPVRCTPNRPLLNFSPAWLPDRVTGQVAAIGPDVIHLHWLAAGFLRLETLRKLNRLNRPLLWTLHDSWAFTGGCHVPFECTRYRQRCGACPVLGSSTEGDLSRKVWERKKKAWENLDLTVVAPSRWLADCARSSSLFCDVRVEVIPNGLDTKIFNPMDKARARELLSLPQDKKLILCGGAGMNLQANKGFGLLKSALRSLASTDWGGKAELVVFGLSGPDEERGSGLKENYLGWLQDEASLAAAYSAADLFVIPSLQENLPNTALEAMACGTPCVAFEQGGMADLIDPGQNGYLARPYDIEDLMSGIRLILENDGLRSAMAQASRLKVETTFALDIVCQRYVALYQELIGDIGGEASAS
ncbi:group 1 glycosyl transferase [Desulfuromonas soudanensis]|uniref:Group 1 glycosyl transferase n=1 Tax=Desulfuromonas soudanensis TaxID=1603606 RepID=A0A0M5IKH5_9BACT|nr:glycosyltransferase [Desulfuromonas soudanensis]ALC15486.1 group 1 glycosyl transferase [Desulfuromonas soudanensis]